MYSVVLPATVDQSKRPDSFNPSDCVDPIFTAVHQPFAASVECTLFRVIMHAREAFARWIG